MDINQLAQQIRSSWGGNWDQGGVDRAMELARLLQGRGISDISQLQITPQQGSRTEYGYGEGGQESWQVPVTTYGLKVGGQDMGGFLGDVNNDGSLTPGGNAATHPDGMLGWSAQGHGNVGYNVQQGADGKYQIVPTWSSSSDAADARTTAMILGTVLGAGALGGAFGGAGAAGGGAGAAGAAGAGGLSVLEPIGAASIGSAPALTASQLAGTTPLSVAPAASSGLLTASTLAKLAGAVGGAMESGDKTQTATQTSNSTKDPWGPAQDWLKQLIGAGQQMGSQYLAQPFSQAQQTAYNSVGGLLNAINSGAGGLMQGMNANASGANNFDRSNPRRQLTGSSFNLTGFNPGLLQFFGGK